ncbi:hypothetical protein KIN20_017995 [Parelaphostrongylus tenuis]|uniref:Uncharacterized protein n=1 Tax=Parelaphostrongylus tenuis TaxID=148309 RepID=A0AAD5N1H6_PARTN|nr:hypothetical protein KIN20_017995 [Parelaphostrongylus tenuis]
MGQTTSACCDYISALFLLVYSTSVLDDLAECVSILLNAAVSTIVLMTQNINLVMNAGLFDNARGMKRLFSRE